MLSTAELTAAPMVCIALCAFFCIALRRRLGLLALIRYAAVPAATVAAAIPAAVAAMLFLLMCIFCIYAHLSVCEVTLPVFGSTIIVTPKPKN